MNDGKIKDIYGDYMELDDFCKRYLPGITDDKKAELSELASLENNGMKLEAMIKRYRPDLTETEQAELVEKIEKEVSPAEIITEP